MSPTSTVTTVEELIAFGLQIFTQIFAMFHHQSVPVAAAPQIAATIAATPGLTGAHGAVAQAAATQAAEAHVAITAAATNVTPIA